MYAQHRVVLVETRDPKGGHEVTGLGSVALPCQLEFMTFLGNLRPEKAHVYLHLYFDSTYSGIQKTSTPEYFDSAVCERHSRFCLCKTN
jgi:hypothetical protein